MPVFAAVRKSRFGSRKSEGTSTKTAPRERFRAALCSTDNVVVGPDRFWACLWGDCAQDTRDPSLPGMLHHSCFCLKNGSGRCSFSVKNMCRMYRFIFINTIFRCRAKQRVAEQAGWGSTSGQPSGQTIERPRLALFLHNDQGVW